MPARGAAIFNVKEFGATGKKADDARPAIQKAINACALAGGGTVRVPPGEYTSGTLHLCSHLRFEIEAGATLYASSDPKAYEYGLIPSKAALLYGEGLTNVSIAGEGIVDGQAEYEWRDDDFEEGFNHKEWMQSLGKSLRRPFPKGFPKRDVFPHLVWLGKSEAVRITGLKLLHSPGWTMALYGCADVAFEGLDIQTSLKEGVWADGIDLDGCKDVRVTKCDIATGDDCLVFISTDVWGPALPCENIIVDQCRLSSASAGVKFSEGNLAGIRFVMVKNTVLTNVNRGFVFSTARGGSIVNVVISGVSIHCNRFDWFWSGEGQPFHFRTARLSEFNKEPPKAGEPPAGRIEGVLIRNVIAHAKGSSSVHGHAESWLNGITLDNVKLVVAADPSAPFEKADHALDFRRVKNLNLRSLDVSWGKPALEAWKSALHCEDVGGFFLDGFVGEAAWPDRQVPVVAMNNVTNALIRHTRTLEGTRIFAQIKGERSRDIKFQYNNFASAKVPCQIEPEVPTGAVKAPETGSK